MYGRTANDIFIVLGTLKVSPLPTEQILPPNSGIIFYIRSNHSVDYLMSNTFPTFDLSIINDRIARNTIPFYIKATTNKTTVKYTNK